MKTALHSDHFFVTYGPKTSAPLCPYSRNRKLIIVVRQYKAISMSSVKLPKPDPSITPYSGLKSFWPL
jgi:hypothetical protein